MCFRNPWIIGSSAQLGILNNLSSWVCFCIPWFMGSSLQKSQMSNERVSEIDGSLAHQHNWVYYIFFPLGYASVFHGSWVHHFKSLKCLMSVFQKSMVHWFISTTRYTIVGNARLRDCLIVKCSDNPSLGKLLADIKIHIRY